jgi:hypothetical protein
MSLLAGTRIKDKAGEQSKPSYHLGSFMPGDIRYRCPFHYKHYLVASRDTVVLLDWFRAADGSISRPGVDHDSVQLQLTTWTTMGCNATGTTNSIHVTYFCASFHPQEDVLPWMATLVRHESFHGSRSFIYQTSAL